MSKLAGVSPLAPAITERIMKRLKDSSTDTAVPQPAGFMTGPDALTKRETEVLRFISGGYSNREIATALRVAEGTVKNHVSNILSKMGVRDRTRAVLKALEEGYI